MRAFVVPGTSDMGVQQFNSCAVRNSSTLHQQLRETRNSCAQKCATVCHTRFEIFATVAQRFWRSFRAYCCDGSQQLRTAQLYGCDRNCCGATVAREQLLRCALQFPPSDPTVARTATVERNKPL